MGSNNIPTAVDVTPSTGAGTRIRQPAGGFLLAGVILVALLSTGIYIYTIPLGIEQGLAAVASGESALPGAWAVYFRAVLDGLVAAVFIGTGILIASRRPDDWLVLIVAFALALTGAANADTFRLAYTPAWPLDPLSALTAFALFCNDTMQVVAILLFPDGRFAPRWMRFVALGWAIHRLVSFAVIYNFVPYSQTRVLIDLVITQVPFYACTLASQVYRYRRAEKAVQRQQTKWVVYAVVIVILVLVPDAVATGLIPALKAPGAVGVAYFLVSSVVKRAALIFVPVAVTFSILRRRLWDIDYIINRSLVYGALTLLLAAAFVGGLFGVQAVFRLITGENQPPTYAVVAGALVAGVLFTPARRALRSLVDRRLYGIEVDYKRAARQAALISKEFSAVTRSAVGDYHGLELIGRGGMAEVYRAIHPTLNRAVAIKILPPHLAADPDFRRRFEREATVVAALKHPNIVQVFDYGEAEGTHYMVMEYIAGPSLADELHRGQAMPFERALTITSEVAGALDYAHAQGLVHRDIKPSNVMLEPITSPSASAAGATGRGGQGIRSERAVLTDFGIARLMSGGTRITTTGMVGTLDYISPEQIHDSSEVDGRADIYSLAVVVFQMLTGQLPFKHGNPGALLLAHLNQPAPDPRKLNPHLAESTAVSILRAMSKRPEERFGTAGEFAAALAG